MVLFPNTSRVSDCHTVSSDNGTRDEVREKQFARVDGDLHSASLKYRREEARRVHVV